MTRPQLRPLAVGILTWNDPDDAARAIRSVEETSPDTPIFVLDNGSTPPFLFDDGEGRVTILRADTNLGVARGRNRLVEVADAEAVLFLDSDARLEAGCLDQLVSTLDSDPRIGLAAPRFTGQHPSESAGRPPSILRKIARAARLTRRYSWAGLGHAPIQDVGFAIGACQLVRIQAFREVGGYEDSAQFGPEDLELCTRLLQARWRVVQVLEAQCTHNARRAHRNPFSRRGLRHAMAVVRYYRRQRRGARSGWSGG